MAQNCNSEKVSVTSVTGSVTLKPLCRKAFRPFCYIIFFFFYSLREIKDI